MLRWAETQGRCGCCTSVFVWADERAVDFWEKQKYKRMDADPLSLGGGHKCYMMQRELIYNIPTGKLLGRPIGHTEGFPVPRRRRR